MSKPNTVGLGEYSNEDLIKELSDRNVKTYEEQVKFLVDEIVHHGHQMKMFGYSLAIEEMNGIKDRAFSTVSSAGVYLKEKQFYEEQSRKRVEYSIDRLVELKINNKIY